MKSSCYCLQRYWQLRACSHCAPTRYCYCFSVSPECKTKTSLNRVYTGFFLKHSSLFTPCWVSGGIYLFWFTPVPDLLTWTLGYLVLLYALCDWVTLSPPVHLCTGKTRREGRRGWNRWGGRDRQKGKAICAGNETWESSSRWVRTGASKTTQKITSPSTNTETIYWNQQQKNSRMIQNCQRQHRCADEVNDVNWENKICIGVYSPSTSSSVFMLTLLPCSYSDFHGVNALLFPTALPLVCLSFFFFSLMFRFISLLLLVQFQPLIILLPWFTRQQDHSSPTPSVSLKSFRTCRGNQE